MKNILNIEDEVIFKNNETDLRNNLELLDDVFYIQEEDKVICKFNTEAYDDDENNGPNAFIEGTKSALSFIWDKTTKLAKKTYQLARTVFPGRKNDLLKVKYKLDDIKSADLDSNIISEYNLKINEKYAGLLTLIDGNINNLSKLLISMIDVTEKMKNIKEYKNIYMNYKFPKDHLDKIEEYLSSKMGLREIKKHDSYYNIIGCTISKNGISYYVYAQVHLNTGYRTEVRRIDIDVPTYEDINFEMNDVIRLINFYIDKCNKLEDINTKQFTKMTEEAIKISQNKVNEINDNNTKAEINTIKAEADVVIDISNKSILTFNSLSTSCFDFIKITGSYTLKALTNVVEYDDNKDE